MLTFNQLALVIAALVAIGVWLWLLRRDGE